MSPMSSRAKKGKAKVKTKAEARLRRGRKNDADDFEAINRAIANVMKINLSVEANKGLKNTNIPNFNGFDMTCIPEIYSSCSFSLVPEKDRIHPRLIRFSWVALDEYNDKNKINYAQLKTVKALSAPFNDGSVYYIIFQALQPFINYNPASFQTLVCEGTAPDGSEALKVEFINMVSPPNPTNEEEEDEYDMETNKSDVANSDDENFDEVFVYQIRPGVSNIDSHNGFDMTCIPKGYSLAFSTLFETELILPQLIRFSQLAIKEYNVKNKTNYVFVKYVKTLAAIVRGIVFYIMFEANQPSDNSPPASFQTFVYKDIPARDGTENLTIEFTNMVSSPSPNKEKGNSCCGGN